MKQKYLVIVFSFLNWNVSAQTNVNMISSVFTNMSSKTYGISSTYWGAGLTTGAQIVTNSGSVSLYALYQFSVNSSGVDFFSMQSHLLGGGVNYRILNLEKRFSPYIEINASTEVGTNYRGGFLDIDGLFPTDYGDFWQKYGPPSQYFSAFYYSTPFVGNILLGCDVRLVDGLHLNVGAGYGLRGMKTREIYWDEGTEPSEELRNTNPKSIQWFNMLDIKLGISYAFSFKKKQ